MFTRKIDLIAQIPDRASLPFYVSAAAVFEGNVRTAVISLKYRNERHFAKSHGRLQPLNISDNAEWIMQSSLRVKWAKN
ncbi:MAG: hypothetical protein NTZ76_01090 [Actinobacteria bacterium]|nr:hypothetical protein [Actinomycetota bacterium]